MYLITIQYQLGSNGFSFYIWGAVLLIYIVRAFIKNNNTNTTKSKTGKTALEQWLDTLLEANQAKPAKSLTQKNVANKDVFTTENSVESSYVPVKKSNLSSVNNLNSSIDKEEVKHITNHLEDHFNTNHSQHTATAANNFEINMEQAIIGSIILERKF